MLELFDELMKEQNEVDIELAMLRKYTNKNNLSFNTIIRDIYIYRSTRGGLFLDYLKYVNRNLLKGIKISETMQNLRKEKEVKYMTNSFSYIKEMSDITRERKDILDCTNFKVTDVKIIVPNKVVEVTFADGSKEKSVCREPDVFSLESAISICVSKKIMGGSGAYNNFIKRSLKVYEDKIKEEITIQAEQKSIEKRCAKRKAYMERRAVKREQAERERQIEIQKEAYIQAMEYMRDCKNEKK